MNILILHRVPYSKIQYSRGIDHSVHTVTYIGKAESLANIPRDLKCKKVIIPGIKKTADEVIETLKNKFNYEVVISMSEYELLDAAEVREYFSLDGPTVRDVLLVRDKVTMKDKIFSNNIKVPLYISCIDLVNGQKPDWDRKTVLKPRKGASSENITVFDSVTKALLYIKNESQNTDLSDYELEEFIDGDILHFDGLIKNGKLLVTVSSRYLGTCLKYAEGNPLGSIQIPLTTVMRKWVSKCIKSIGIDRGAFHLEAIDSCEGLVFLEIANRVGGADVVDTFELHTGIHLPSEELKLMIGCKSQQSFSNQAKNFYGWFVFPGHHLIDDKFDICGLDYLKNHPNIYRFKHLDKSQRLPRSITYQSFEVPVSGIIQSKSSKEILKELKNIFSKIQVYNTSSRVVGMN